MKSLTVASASIACSAAILFVSINGFAAESQDKSAADAAPAPAFIREETRNGVRTLMFDSQMDDGFGKSAFLTADYEIDVSSAVLTVFCNPPGTIFHGSAFVQHDDTILNPITITSTGQQTIQLTFDPPIPLREGDSLNLNSQGPLPGVSTYYVLNLSGYVPSARTSGIVAR